MQPYTNKLVYKNVFGQVKAATGVSNVILSADFSVVEFTMTPALTAVIGTVVGTFVVGETVMGGTSNVIGIVFAVTDDTITLIDVSGTFTNAETITGGTSGATAAISSISTPNFTIVAYISNQENLVHGDIPPDPTLSPTPLNTYTQVTYVDEGSGTNYNPGSEYNPNIGSPTGTLSYTPRTFRFGTDGQPVTARWVFLEVAFDERSGGGALVDADIILSNL